MENADTLVLLGTQFPYRAFYPSKPTLSKSTLIQIVLVRIVMLIWRWLAILKATLNAIQPRLKEKQTQLILMLP